MGTVTEGPWAWHDRRAHDKLPPAFDQAYDQGTLASAAEIPTAAERAEERGRSRGTVRRGHEVGHVVAHNRRYGLLDRREDTLARGVAPDGP